jgi:hypothetical protein
MSRRVLLSLADELQAIAPDLPKANPLAIIEA